MDTALIDPLMAFVAGIGAATGVGSLVFAAYRAFHKSNGASTPAGGRETIDKVAREGLAEARAAREGIHHRLDQVIPVIAAIDERTKRLPCLRDPQTGKVDPCDYYLWQ